jgi:phage terminase large subunit
MPILTPRQYKVGAPVFQVTEVFRKNADAYMAGKRRIMNEGGSASSKTWSALQLLIILAQNQNEIKRPLIISIVSESLPHLKLGAMRDFFNILGETQDGNLKWGKSSFVYQMNEWATIEFFGADDQGKAHGPRRQILYINEANNVPWETAKALDMRTERCTIADWNPVSEFWAHSYEDSDGRKIKGWAAHHKNDKGDEVADDPTTEFIKSTYKDALQVIPKSVIDNLESYRDKDPNTWSIYGLGILGKIEGLVYPLFQIIDTDKFPQGRCFYGLDFGFSGDPAGVVKNIIVGDNLYSHELIYKRGLTNDDLARELDLLKVGHSETIFADSAEPKSIEEVRRKGFNVKPTEKGKGSVEYGVQKVNQYYQYWTKDSVNGIKEQRNFRYIKDPQTGSLTDKTTHQWSHLLDARRYACAGKRFDWSPTIVQSLEFSNSR